MKIAKGERRKLIERLARYLNDLCVDWPPIGYNWANKKSALRRQLMRDLAKQAINMLERVE